MTFGKSRGRRRVAVDQHRHVKFTKNELDDALQGQAVHTGGGSSDPSNRKVWSRCHICDIYLGSRTDYERHFAGRRHRHTILILALEKNRNHLTENKYDITLCCDVEDSEETHGVISFEIDEIKTSSINLIITNNSQKDILILHKCEFLKFMREYSIQYQDKGKDVLILPGDQFKVTVNIKAKLARYYKTPIAFLFTKESNSEHKIHIVRYLSARCTNSIIRACKPTAKYKGPKRVAIFVEDLKKEDGLPLPSLGKSALEREVELKPYLIPRKLRGFINSGGLNENAEVKEENLETRDVATGELTYMTHHKKFEQLIHIEEQQMEVDIRQYDMKGVAMEKYKENSRLLVLKVPGLSENRPSVLKGDFLFARCHLGPNKDGTQNENADGTPKKGNVEYKGYVHEVFQNEVGIGFSSNLHSKHLKGMKFDVRFTFSRHPIRLQHRAVELAFEHSLYNVLFPEPDTVCRMGTIVPLDVKLHLYDRNLESNLPQLTAVEHILSGTSRPAPYIVYGPPGTGKTVTIVEAIKQVWKHIPSAHILACAPSNSAADLITKRLLKHVDVNDVYRMIASSRQYSTVPEDIKKVCNYNKTEGCFEFPEKAVLQKYKIIVCTLVTAGRLASANFPSGHFSHVFIDEAGHAVEPEAIIPIAGIMESDIISKDGGQIVLAGDPKQLGPVLRSPLAKKFGLETSLLERLMETPVYERQEIDENKPVEERLKGYTIKYKTGPYNENLVTKLVQNYRSHPALLKLPNEMFYDNELQAHADRLVTEMFCKWSELPKQGFPIIFHGLLGKDKREERSPSFFNAEEVSAVVDYVKKLLENRNPKVQEKDIGIIAPYRKQVQKIKQILRSKNYKDIQVGSTEEFQGQEKLVIIVSTVRSDPDYLKEDVKFRLGFLQNPKRFNVAVTRAKALMIVIGNPFYLDKDEHWNSLLQYCIENEAFLDNDCDYKQNVTDEEVNEVITRFKTLMLEHIKNDIVNDDAPWKGDD